MLCLATRPRTALLQGLALLLSGGLTAAVGGPDAEPQRPLFETYEVALDVAERQTVLTGFLLGNAIADLALVRIGENGERRLRIYEFGGNTWVPRLDATLRPAVSFVDVARIDGRDRLLTYERGRLSWFDTDSTTERELLTVPSSFRPPREDEIPHVDITRDLNDDGRDDLVVPDVEGFRILIQLEDGAFADPVSIGRTCDLSRIYGADGYRYDVWGQSRVHTMDYDHDGRGDLVFWNVDRFEVHRQDQRGLFPAESVSFTTDVPFDSDDLSALATGEMRGRVLHSLADLDGDGTGDLVVHSLEGPRISDKRSAYEVHFGARTPDGGTAFASEVGARFQSKDRIQISMSLYEFDGDRGVGVMLTTVDVGRLERSLWKTLKGFMGDNLGVHLEFYQAEGGRYAERPDTVRGMGLTGAPDHRSPGWIPLDLLLRGGTHESRRTGKGWPRSFDKNFLLGDVTGDGRADLLIEETFRGLALFVGVPGPERFARQSRNVDVIVPNDREYTRLVDLNRDGKQDILLHDPSPSRDVHGAPTRPPGSEAHRLKLLLAR